MHRKITIYQSGPDYHHFKGLFILMEEDGDMKMNVNSLSRAFPLLKKRLSLLYLGLHFVSSFKFICFSFVF
jgi:predicted acetyltransferase